MTFYCFYPSDPVLERVNLSHFKIHKNPTITLDVVKDFTVKVYNRDVYSPDYHSLIVSIGYHGKKSGFVSSNEGHLKPRSYNPFDNATEIQGRLELFFFQFPIKINFYSIFHWFLDMFELIEILVFLNLIIRHFAIIHILSSC
ncbi:hypothetical protein MKW98_002246 [Papaver atlanticum]|uniref:Uncharacterized protein n=1 Tax=Papaver atlanticum TaxID=357466 RepID=A0AAD4RUK7_9MAGN|nr:hypothetical protein MKW98_002246 [Papaver atlanticum]